MSSMTEKGNTVEAVGEATPDHVIANIVAAAAKRDDLPEDFHTRPVSERLRLLELEID